VVENRSKIGVFQGDGSVFAKFLRSMGRPPKRFAVVVRGNTTIIIVYHPWRCMVYNFGGVCLSVSVCMYIIWELLKALTQEVQLRTPGISQENTGT